MNNNRRAFQLTIFRSALLIAIVCIFSLRIASAEPLDFPIAQPTPPRLGEAIRIWPACTANDKLEVTSLTVTPVNPSIGHLLTIVMKIKNICPSRTASLNVPWDIKKDSSRIAEGTVTLGPGETRDVSAQWTLVWPPDQHDWDNPNFSGNADPGNTISETVRKNNTKYFKVFAGIALDRYLLNHVNAKNAGATFTANADGFTPCSLETNGGASGSNQSQVHLKINCSSWPAGGKADYEGYVGFTLKNHWIVRSYQIVESSRADFREGAGKGWSWVSPPPSSANPYFKLHLWADGFHGIEVFVKIMIEGPSGTNPY